MVADQDSKIPKVKFTVYYRYDTEVEKCWLENIARISKTFSEMFYMWSEKNPVMVSCFPVGNKGLQR